MITVRELISRIRTGIHRGNPSNTSISKRYIYNIAKTVRSKILYEQEQKNINFKKEYFLQTISCVKFKEVDWNECKLKPASGCKLLKSDKPIPMPIGGTLENVFSDSLIKYNKTTINKLSIPNTRFDFLKRNQSYFLRNIGDETFLYLISTENPKWLNIEGLFEDEEAVKLYCGDECFSLLDSIFYIDNRLIDTLIKLVLDEILKVYQRSIKDNTSDGIDNSGQNEKKD